VDAGRREWISKLVSWLVKGDRIMDSEKPKKIHWLQRLLDNPWVLLALGVIIPTLSYTVWGWIELVNLLEAKLP
jgi:hypothetical protein